MKNGMMVFLLLIMSSVLVACQTVDPATSSISWRMKQEYFKKMRDPRIFGLNLYQTPTGVEIHGGGRLHPNQTVALDVLVEEPSRPVVGLITQFDKTLPALLDITSSRTWLEYASAVTLRATPLGEQDPTLIRLVDDDIDACYSMISSLRLGQLFIEYPTLYVRLATGSMGPLTRGMDDQNLRCVVGWDLLKKFEYIQFLYPVQKVILSTTEEYEPDPGLLVASLSLLEDADKCAVRGTVDGHDAMILVDPAGDFEVALPEGLTAETVDVGLKWPLKNPQISRSPRGVRIGARIFQHYHVTICPKQGLLHIERFPPLGE